MSIQITNCYTVKYMFVDSGIKIVILDYDLNLPPGPSFTEAY